MEQIISEKEKHREFLEEQLERITELPHDMLVLVLKRIKKEAKEIMKSIAQVKVALPQNYEKNASAILACQKLISSADHMNPQTGDFQTVEKERTGDKKTLLIRIIEKGRNQYQNNQFINQYSHFWIQMKK